MTINIPFVSSIAAGEVALVNVNNQLKERIRKRGIRIRQSSRSGQTQKGWLYVLFEPYALGEYPWIYWPL